MRLTPSQLKSLAAFAEEPAETPEEFVKALVAKIDELQAAKPGYTAVAKIAGNLICVGPFSTPLQASKALKGAMPVATYTPEGWRRHIAALDEPVGSRGDFAEVAKDAAARKNGWRGKARERDDYL